MVDRLVNSEANARRIATVENCFGVSGQPLAIQGRALVGEGVLTKMCRKKAKARQFYLFNDILVYGNIVMDKKKYNKQHIIPLEEVKLENLQDDGILKNGWLIRTPTKSFAVYAATATEKTEWMAHINKCVENLLKKTGKRPSLENAAVWIPDAEASICMHCRKTQFTVLNRRHHCRKCGAVICNSCSTQKCLLPSQSSKPLRVCDSCYDTLTNARVNVGAWVNTLPEKPANQDSSGEDDSEDDLDDNRKDALATDMGDMTLDEKPVFYGDPKADTSSTGDCNANSNKSAHASSTDDHCTPTIQVDHCSPAVHTASSTVDTCSSTVGTSSSAFDSSSSTFDTCSSTVDTCTSSSADWSASCDTSASYSAD